MQCYKCHTDKPHTELYFIKNKTCAGGIGKVCKDCDAIRRKNLYNKDPEKFRIRRIRCHLKKTPEERTKLARKHRLKRAYGLTLEQAESLLSRGCEICKSSLKLGIDHCHETGEVRGCLCYRCNTALGYVCEDASIAERLRLYILLKCVPIKASAK